MQGGAQRTEACTGVARESLDLTRQGYQGGNAGYVQVLDAQRLHRRRNWDRPGRDSKLCRRGEAPAGRAARHCSFAVDPVPAVTWSYSCNLHAISAIDA